MKIPLKSIAFKGNHCSLYTFDDRLIATNLLREDAEQIKLVFDSLFHPQIHIDFYKWWEKEQDNPFYDKATPQGIAMQAFTRGRETIREAMVKALGK